VLLVQPRSGYCSYEKLKNKNNSKVHETYNKREKEEVGSKLKSKVGERGGSDSIRKLRKIL
jgi:hypothetical protein